MSTKGIYSRVSMERGSLDRQAYANHSSDQEIGADFIVATVLQDICKRPDTWRDQISGLELA